VLVELDPTVGHEQRGTRPCISVSDPAAIEISLTMNPPSMGSTGGVTAPWPIAGLQAVIPSVKPLAPGRRRYSPPSASARWEGCGRF
jgi:hypothetical protein